MRSFIWTIYNRYETLIQANHKNNISLVRIFDTENINLAPDDSFQFNNTTNNEYFNSIILSKIIKELKIFKYKKYKKLSNNVYKKNKIKIKKNIFKECLNFTSSNVFFMEFIFTKNNIMLKLLVNKNHLFLSY